MGNPQGVLPVHSAALPTDLLMLWLWTVRSPRTTAHCHLCHTSFPMVTGGSGFAALYVAVRHYFVLSFWTGQGVCFGF